MPKLAIGAVLILLWSVTAMAQTPYASMQSREIKALSEQQIADLRAGRGMGLALPAELNGYPGPAHLLELADQIGLADGQRVAVSKLFEAMKMETIPLGERLVVQERSLDRLFANRTATPENVAAATTAIGDTQGKLRGAHLKYHVSTIAILEPRQIQRYAELRGYAGGETQQRHRH